MTVELSTGDLARRVLHSANPLHAQLLQAVDARHPVSRDGQHDANDDGTNECRHV